MARNTAVALPHYRFISDQDAELDGKYCVYGLFDQHESHPFYVGYTSHIKVRLRIHIRDAYNRLPECRTAKDLRIININRSNRPVICEVLGIFNSKTEGLHFEAKTIKRLGFNKLTNSSNPRA